MLNQQSIYINLTCNCRVCLGVVFLCLLCACLPSLTTLESIDQQHFAKTKIRYISLPSNLNAIIGITSYYCVILKMVILHDVTKTIQNGVFAFFKNKNLFFLKKKQNTRICKETKKPWWVGVFKKTRDFSNLVIFQYFFVIFPWSHDLEQVTSPSVWLGVRRTPRV